MKILTVSDKIGSAIWIVGGRPLLELNDRIKIDSIAVHPKRPSVEQLKEFEDKAKEADLIDFHYWKTAEMLLERYAWLKDKPKILTHYNPYDVDNLNWFKKYDKVVVVNQTQKKTIIENFKKEPLLIPLTTDLEFFKFQREYPKEDIFKVNMVVARIEGKKGILEVAKACRETKSRLTLVGRVSDINYLREVVMSAGDYIDFKEDISIKELREVYYQSHLHICNSEDGFESGTLPILESMACGVPVLTRSVGHVPDIYNHNNLFIREGEKEDVDDLVRMINEIKDDRDRRIRMREEAFRSIISRDNRYRIIKYYNLYREVLSNEKPVTVVIPTYNRAGVLGATLAGVVAQDYSNLEVVVVDDGSSDNTEEIVKCVQENSSVPILYIKQDKIGYGLARARNTGVVEASGEIIVFQDDRLIMKPNAVSSFVAKLKPMTWLFGDKGADKRAFVENFSCIYRRDLIGMGMFNERIIYYGGMTRDIINRMGAFGMKYEYCPEAKCSVLIDSKSRYKNKDEIVKAKLLLWKLGGFR